MSHIINSNKRRVVLHTFQKKSLETKKENMPLFTRFKLDVVELTTMPFIDINEMRCTVESFGLSFF